MKCYYTKLSPYSRLTAKKELTSYKKSLIHQQRDSTLCITAPNVSKNLTRTAMSKITSAFIPNCGLSSVKFANVPSNNRDNCPNTRRRFRISRSSRYN